MVRTIPAWRLLGAVRAPDGVPAADPTTFSRGTARMRLDVVEPLDLVLLGRRVAPALLGEDVDDDRPVPLGGVGEGLFHRADVVAVDGTGVADAERLEEHVRRDELAQGAGQAEDPRSASSPMAGMSRSRLRRRSRVCT